MSQDEVREIRAQLPQLQTQLQHVSDQVRDVRGLIGPWAVNLADGNLLVHTIHQILLIVDSLDVIITPQLVVYRQWEPDITALLWNSLRSDTVFVDVGANIGYFSCLAGARIQTGGGGQVIAVEPNPKCCELMGRNLAINWSMCPVTLHRVAVGAKRGDVWLTSPHNRAANAHMASEQGDESLSHSMRVPLETLDALVPEGLAVDVMKIDVEGHEFAVFQGANRVFSQSPNIKIIMEWSPKQMFEAGFSVDVMAYKLKSLGLVPRRLPSSHTLDNLDDASAPQISFEQLSQVAYDNILLTRRA